MTAMPGEIVCSCGWRSRPFSLLAWSRHLLTLPSRQVYAHRWFGAGGNDA